MRSHSGHVHSADKLLPFYLTTLQFCFSCFTLQENRQLVNSATCLLFPSSPVSRKQTCSKLYITSTSYLQCPKQRRKKSLGTVPETQKEATSVGTIGTSQQRVKTIPLPACFIYIYLFLLHFPPSTVQPKNISVQWNHFCHSGELSARLFKWELEEDMSYLYF